MWTKDLLAERQTLYSSNYCVANHKRNGRKGYMLHVECTDHTQLSSGSRPGQTFMLSPWAATSRSKQAGRPQQPQEAPHISQSPVCSSNLNLIHHLAEHSCAFAPHLLFLLSTSQHPGYLYQHFYSVISHIPPPPPPVLTLPSCHSSLLSPPTPTHTHFPGPRPHLLVQCRDYQSTMENFWLKFNKRYWVRERRFVVWIKDLYPLPKAYRIQTRMQMSPKLSSF